MNENWTKQKNNQTTVVIDVSYEVENNVARDFVRDEHATVFFNLKDKEFIDLNGT